MPRGIPNMKTTDATAALPAPEKPARPKVPGLERRLSPTTLHHVYNFDIKGDGRFREVAVVKMVKHADGSVQSVYYIDIQLLDNIDKGRLKQAVTNVHADKYQLWDLLSQIKLSNGKNALDYFHQLTRVEHGPGATNTQMGGGLAGVRAENNLIVGAEFSDPASGAVNSQESPY
jgi:hypothetical protein